MKYLDLSFKKPSENLACDEALLDLCETPAGEELLRFWTSEKDFVVLGYSNKIDSEVDLTACRENHIPVYRRISGGGCVLLGPGCLNYSLFLKIRATGRPQGIKTVTDHILNRHRQAVGPMIDRKISVAGTSDLACGGLKFSGNAQRRRKNFFLFHGTFLLDFDIPRIGRFLKIPPRQPPYRKNRPHEDFLINLQIPAREIKTALKKCWDSGEEFKNPPLEKIRRLAAEKYQAINRV